MSSPSSNYLLSSLPLSSTPVILSFLCGSHKEQILSAYNEPGTVPGSLWYYLFSSCNSTSGYQHPILCWQDKAYRGHLAYRMLHSWQMSWRTRFPLWSQAQDSPYGSLLFSLHWGYYLRLLSSFVLVLVTLWVWWKGSAVSSRFLCIRDTREKLSITDFSCSYFQMFSVIMQAETED